MENILLAATSLELGSCWIGAFDEQKVKDIFSIPDGIEPHGLILIGYTDEKSEKIRNSLDTFIYFNKYGEKIRSN